MAKDMTKAPGNLPATSKDGSPLTRRQQDRSRIAIETTRIIKRLQAFVLGETVNQYNPKTQQVEERMVEMSAQQVNAALGLLRKNLPDLKAIEVGLDEETKERLIAGRPMSEEEWQKSFGAPSQDHKPH